MYTLGSEQMYQHLNVRSNPRTFDGKITSARDLFFNQRTPHVLPCKLQSGGD